MEKRTKREEEKSVAAAAANMHITCAFVELLLRLCPTLLYLDIFLKDKTHTRTHRQTFLRENFCVHLTGSLVCSATCRKKEGRKTQRERRKKK